MKRKTLISGVLVFCMVFTMFIAFGSTAQAKTYKSLSKGGYYITYKKAKISKGKLIVKGKVKNWDRIPSTKYYNKKGTFKLKMAKKCTLQDGYKPSYNISKKKFNKLCKKRDFHHRGIAITVKKKKVTSIRFW